MRVSHSFTSGKAVNPAAAANGEVTPEHWNADHTIEGVDFVVPLAATEAALNAALAQAVSGNKRLRLAGMSFLLTASFASAAANLVIEGPGALIPTTSMQNVLHLTGNNPKVRDVIIPASDLAKCGIRIEAADSEVTGCEVSDIYSDGSTGTGAFGIHISGATGRTTADNNVVSRVESANNSIVGDSIGTARGIHISGSSDAKRTLVRNNVIDEIRGEDADGISVFFTIGLISKEAHASITGNEISNCDKRAIKTQCRMVRIDKNTYRHTGAAPSHPDWLISAQLAHDVYVGVNNLDATQFKGGVQVYGVTDDHAKGCSVTRNDIKVADGLVNLAATYPIAVAYCDDIQIVDNVSENGSRWIYLFDCLSPVVGLNKWLITSGAARGYGVYTDGTTSGLVARGNVAKGTGGTNYASELFRLVNADHILDDNVAWFDTSTAHATVYFDNGAGDSVIRGSINHSSAGLTTFKHASAVITGAKITGSINMGGGSVGLNQP